MSVEFTKAGEHRVQEYISSVLNAHKGGRVGSNVAATSLFMAMKHAAHDDPQLDAHMRHWMDATKPRGPL